MQLIDFQWQERQGRYDDDTPFHEWIFQHGSGRIVASIQGSTERGGFTCQVIFLFNQHVTMQGGPFLFTDFDSGKRFAESVVGDRLEGVTAEGALHEVQMPNPNLVAMSEAMKVLQQIAPGIRLPEVPMPQTLAPSEESSAV